MSLRPRQDPMAVTQRGRQRMAPGRGRWSESPIPRMSSRRTRAVGEQWTYSDGFYFSMVAQTSDGAGADTWGGAANGQDFADDGINDEEAICRTELSHDTYGGSPWTLYDGTGTVLNLAGNSTTRSRIRFDPKPSGEDMNLGIQLSWPLDTTIQQWWTDNYVGQEGSYGYSGTFPATFSDAWITSYKLRLSAQGGAGQEWWFQFVTDLDDTSPSYTTGTEQTKFYVADTGNTWDGDKAGTWYVADRTIERGTEGWPVGSWGGDVWRLRIGMDEEAIAPGAPVQIVELDQVRLYVYFTVSL